MKDYNSYGMETKRLPVEPILASPEKVYGISLQRKCEGGRWVLLPSLFATKLHLSRDSLRAYDGGRTVGLPESEFLSEFVPWKH